MIDHDCMPVVKDWAASVLPIRLKLPSGSHPPAPGMEPIEIKPAPDDDSRVDVWLWSHWVADPAGDCAQHFSYVCQVSGSQKDGTPSCFFQLDLDFIRYVST